MHAKRLEPPRQSDIRLDLVGMNNWQVRDRRLPDGDSAGVLGMIVRNEARYVVSGARQGEYGSLSAATAAFATESA
jgi:hypothetical protein